MADGSKPPLARVFTPTGFPFHTYVDRNDAGVERSVTNAFETPGTVLSISGPSKSGKTVLVKRIVGDDHLIQVSGGSIESTDQLWDMILSRLSIPSEQTETHSKTSGSTGKISGTIGIPKVFSHDASKDQSTGFGKTVARKFPTSKIDAIVGQLAGVSTVIFIDDFHYMSRPLQNRIARQVKFAAENDVHFCIASVPHRSDDVVRSNSELRGRTVNIDTEFWSVEELSRIGALGFPKVDLSVDMLNIHRLASEACGSPQLMQALCLEFGRSITGLESYDDEQVFEAVLSETSKRTDYSSLVRAMHQGPRLRRERTLFDFVDGTSGDVYRAILLALSHGEPSLTWNYIELRQAIAAVCTTNRPTGSSFVDACRSISTIVRNHAPTQRILEWDGSAGNGTLSIVDPYFLFFIRQSRLLDRIGKRKA